MEFARTELPHSGLLTPVPDWPYALLHSQVVKQHFCSCWCWWCPCGCYCFHPDPLLFPGAPACSVPGCTTAMSQLLSAQENRCSSCHIPGGTACLAASLKIPCVGWKDGCFPLGRSEQRWVAGLCAGGNSTFRLWGERSHFKLVRWGWKVRWKGPVGSGGNRQAILLPAGIQGSEGFGRGQQKCSVSQ